MRRRRKKRASPALAILLLVGMVILAVLVIVRTADSGEELPVNQVTGNLNTTSETPVATDVVDTQEPPQEKPRQEIALPKTPARVARYINIEISEDEMKDLLAIVYLEAGNQSLKGQQAVVEVIFNRVLHSGFPDTIHDVLHEGEGTSVPQFSTVYNIGNAEPTWEQYTAVNDALYGESILPLEVVFFARSPENDRVWGYIEDHCFCYEYIWE